MAFNTVWQLKIDCLVVGENHLSVEVRRDSIPNTKTGETYVV